MPEQLPGVRTAHGPAAGDSYHSYCLDCHRVLYNLNKYGPVTPYMHNRTFCICRGKQTGEIALKVTVYDLEDVLPPEEAKIERKRQEDAGRERTSK